MNHAPPHFMTTEERLEEIATILRHACLRLDKKNKINGIEEKFPGHSCPPKRPCRKEETET